MGHSKLKSKVMHLNKKQVEDLKTYLENAKGNTISISSWSKNWTYKPISNDDDAISTQKDWGAEKHDMSEVLKAYKEMYDI
ncbi:hypothetical protein HG530_014546 [Fusarium avenaceum]|nr:hypothetical protein HG530_014546 [Fusarium avenaceum]